MSSDNKPIYIKVPILGNTNVGKSTLFHLLRGLTEKEFTYKTNNFILIEQVRFKNYIFNIQFWDNFGANTLTKMQKDIFQGSTIGLVMYDISDMSKVSYEDTRKWANELWKNNALKRLPIILVANKIDLRHARRPTLDLKNCSEIARDLSRECNIPIPQIEISALSRENCEKIIDNVLDLVVRSNLIQ